MYVYRMYVCMYMYSLFNYYVLISSVSLVQKEVSISFPSFFNSIKIFLVLKVC